MRVTSVSISIDGAILRDGRNDKYGLLTRKREMNNKLIQLVRDIDERTVELTSERRMYVQLEAMYNKMTNSRWIDDERVNSQRGVYGAEGEGQDDYESTQLFYGSQQTIDSTSWNN